MMHFLKSIKQRITPKSLLPRMLLIIIVPTIIAQSISTYIFYNKHWDSIQKYIIYTLSTEISLITNMHNSIPEQNLPQNNTYTFLRYQFIKGAKVPTEPARGLPREIRILKDNIHYNLPDKEIYVSYNKKSKELEVQVATNKGVLAFFINHRKISTQNTQLFILWTLASTLILLSITIVFAKNQIRSITKLSKVAKKLAKGANINSFIPQGATEVRNAGYALLKMKETLEEEVTHKASMLAGVSHDLKTPITRLKLHVELLPDDAQKDIKKDIKQMENIINDYLEFASQASLSRTKLVNITFLVRKLANYFRTPDLQIELLGNKKMYANISENQFTRAISNMINNAARFASNILIKLREDEKNIILEIHDNGPGIPEAEIKNVLKPFYRIDNSRNQDSGGIGLGMSIAKDIIEQHRGTISLAKSFLGGLLVVITIPK